MVCIAENRCPTHPIKYNPAATLSDPEFMIQQESTDLGAKYLFHDTALLEPAATSTKEAAWLFIERVRADYTVTVAAEDFAGTVVESGSDVIKHKTQQLSKPVVKPLSDTRSEIKRVLAYLGVVTKNDVEVIVETRLTKWIRTLLLQILKTIESTIEYELKARYFNSNIGL